jgi:succinate dehydrogenase / fumarate reductase flavoprotein subunit
MKIHTKLNDDLPAVHYTMELGLIIIYKLQFQVVSHWRIKLLRSRSKQIRASALMQGFDGYFVLPYTIGDYLSPDIKMGPISTDSPEFEAAEKGVKEIEKFMNNNGTHSVDYFHRKLGKIMG